MDYTYLEHFLPKELITHFDIVSIEKKEGATPLTGVLEIHMDEKNQLYREDRSEYESKGFCPAAQVQDFPIRGKSVFFHIRRRKWRHKLTGKEVRNSYDLTADGSRMTKELSDFLKDARRDA